MKALKITLLLAVFVVSFSGSNTDVTETKTDFERQVEIYKQKKEDHKLLAVDRDGTKKPGQNNI